MPTYDKFLIAPFADGLRTDLEPWLIPDESFAVLYNAYVWRGRVRKRFGGQLMGSGADSSLTAPLLSRFRINIGTTAGGILAGTVPGDTFMVGQQFSVGDVIFTATNGTAGAQQMLRTDASAAAATYDTSTGAFNITGAPNAAPVYFYPLLPVMGLANYAIGAVNNHPSFGFDVNFAYEFVTNSWQRSAVADAPIFHGDDTNFFWTTNYTAVTSDQVALFVTNYNFTPGTPGADDDPMWYYCEQLTPEWGIFNPPFNAAGDIIYTAKIILPYKGMLLLLNVVEQDAAGTTNTVFINRCRYSWVGVPLTAAAPNNAFIQPDNIGYGGGGFVDAATDEAIVTAEFIKDRLIVYFERSTWELAFTGNHANPLIWQKINTELGAESTFSAVPFDKAILAIGNTGVHACSGANVERIDIKIPDQIFEIINKNEGVSRVVGIRDYYVEMVYWTFPNIDENADATFPNSVLVYNYKTNSWAFNDDCITMFGNFEQQSDITWADETMQWQQNNSTWSSGVQQSQFRQVIAGNQQGFVFIVAPDFPMNAPVMSVTNVALVGPLLLNLTVIDHTLAAGEFIYLSNMQGTGINPQIVEIQAIVDIDTIQIDTPPGFTGVYLGGGSIARVSIIDLLTKQFNPYVDQDRNVFISKVEFGVKRTSAGAITVDYFPSSSELSMVQNATATGTILGTSVLETSPYPVVPLEELQTRLWHPVYLQTEGESIQLHIYLSDDQMLNPDTAFSEFWLDGMLLYAIPTTSRMR